MTVFLQGIVSQSLGILLLIFPVTEGFYGASLPSSFTITTQRRQRLSLPAASQEQDWITLDDGIDKLRMEQGDVDTLPVTGDPLTLCYTGRLDRLGWTTVNDVIDHWLSHLQGFEHLMESFHTHDITGDKLLDEAFLTEEFCTNELGLTNKLQCKKLLLAVKRLRQDVAEYPEGTEFDSSTNREGGVWHMTLGQTKVIPAMHVGVSSMNIGERATIRAKSSKAYGKDGLRSRDGTVIVPPFATLLFDVTRIS